MTTRGGLISVQISGYPGARVYSDYPFSVLKRMLRQISVVSQVYFGEELQVYSAGQVSVDTWDMRKYRTAQQNGKAAPLNT